MRVWWYILGEFEELEVNEGVCGNNLRELESLKERKEFRKALRGR